MAGYSTKKTVKCPGIERANMFIQTSPNSRYLVWQRCHKQFNRVVSGTICGKIGQSHSSLCQHKIGQSCVIIARKNI